MPEDSPTPDAVIDGGDLDCGSGLLLMIRNAMDPLGPGMVLEVRSRDGSVREDLPAWCRMVGHALLDVTGVAGGYTHYRVRKKAAVDETALKDDLARARDYEWKLRVKWTGGMEAKVLSRNHAFVVGQPLSFNTEDEHVSALEYLLGALGSCLLLGLQWRLSQRGVKVANLELSIQAKVQNALVFLGIEDDGSPGLSHVKGKAYVQADAADAALKAEWENTVRRSPVAQTILRGAPVDIEFMRVS
jgi:TusA-related sulfurtransferase/uncharacterized OsmC-like protein